MIGAAGIAVAVFAEVGAPVIAAMVLSSVLSGMGTNALFYTLGNVISGDFNIKDLLREAYNGAANGFMFGGIGAGAHGIQNLAKSGKLMKFLGNESGSVEFTGGKGGSKSINPNEIRYSQSSVNGSSDIIQSMNKNGWKGEPIDVVEMPDGIYTTIDNTRVVSARKSGINVQANTHGYNDPLPSEYIDRFTTKKGVPKIWGEAVELRVGKQNKSFRNGNPYGKFDMKTIN